MNTEPDFREEQSVGKVYDGQLLRRLLGYVAPYRGMAIGAVVLIMLSSVLQLVGPLVTALALDLFVRPLAGLGGVQSTLSQWAEGWLLAQGRMPTEDPMAGILFLVAIFAMAILLSFVVLYFQGYLMQLMGQYIMYDLRRDIYRRLQHMHVAYFDRQPVGRLVTRATTDVAALNELFTAGLVSIFGDIMLLFGIVGVLFLLDWRLALVSFSIIPLLLALTVWFKSGARKMFREVRVKIARINAFLQERIGGMSTVQLFGAEAREFDEFSRINEEHRDANIRAVYYYAVYYPAVELVTSIGLASIVWYGGGQILRGTLSLGALVAFLQYAQRFYQPLADLSEKYNILQAAMASAERIFELLDTEPEIVAAPGAHQAERLRGDIRFDEVTFSYKEGDPVLRQISFDIQAGETVAVVGHTGAGKSTLANLLLRFYDVDQGAVRVDGLDVRDWHPASLRRGVALVLQDVFLFSGDLAANIGLGDPSIDDERLRQAAEQAHAMEFIERLPKGFGTGVKERGAGLSVGQKQLIAFARALARDPSILILDEATASIDSETEQLIQAALDKLLQGRTSIVIAHRLSTIRKADRILVLHKGELREQGTHHELLERGGIYQKLYELQFQHEPEAIAS